MTLMEIAAGVFMSGIMIAVPLLIAKLIRDILNTIKKQKDPKE